MSRRSIRFTCVALVLILASAVRADAAPRRVLLLYSYEREFSHYTFASLFRPELTRSSADPIDFIEIALDSVRARQTASPAALVERVRAAIEGDPLDLVVPLGNPAAAFVQSFHEQLFPGTPVLLAAFDSRFVQASPLSVDETAVAVRNDPYRMLQTILEIAPDTKTVMIVIGASAPERFWVREVERLVEPLRGRVSFIFTNQLTFAQLLKQAGSLPPHSAIFYGIYSMDAAGVPQMELPTLEALHAAADAPIFGLHSHQLGHGIVGGPLLSLEDVSHDTTNVALRLLRGEPATRMPARTIAAGRPVFDARELRRWNIADARLAPGSIIRYRQPSVWMRHEGLLAAAATFVAAQTALLLGLTLTLVRKRRSRVTDGSDVSHAEAALARLSHRLLAAQEEERSRIASTLHDDVCQQLTGLKMRLESLSLDPKGDGAMRARLEQVCDQFGALEARLLALSDPVYARLEMLGLVGSARAFAHRLCQQNGIALEFRADGVPARLSGRITLTMFRVLEEAMRNAVSHADTARIVVSLAVRHGRLELEVDDEGKGFDPAAAIRADGVGLIDMRERLRLVGGTCTFVSRPGAGTRVLARVKL
jgi:signal transduction histidine kinase